MCYLASVYWYRLPVASLTAGLNSVPIMERFSVMSRSRSQGTEVTIVTGDVTAHAHREGRVCSNICSCYGLLTFADNTCLLDVSLHRIIISIHFPLVYAI